MTSGDVAMLVSGRRWAAAALEAHLVSIPIPAPPVLPDWVWHHVARCDRVAWPLVAACGAGGHPTPAVLRTAAIRDGQQRLLLHARAAEVAAAAARAGLRLIFIKGAAEVADPAAEPTGDLDTLVSVAELPAMLAALKPLGMIPTSPLVPGVSHAVYLERPDDPVTMDLHLMGYGWDRAFLERCIAEAQPMAGIPDALVPQPHHLVWQLLVHGILHHPERRGSLRDARRLRRLALRLAAESSNERREWVEQQVAGHRSRGALGAAWAAANQSVTAAAAWGAGERLAVARELLSRQPLSATGFAMRRQDLLFTMLGPSFGWRELLRQQVLLQHVHPGGPPRPRAFVWRWRWRVPFRVALTAALAPLVVPRAWRVWIARKREAAQ